MSFGSAGEYQSNQYVTCQDRDDRTDMNAEETVRLLIEDLRSIEELFRFSSSRSDDLSDSEGP